MAHKTFIFKEDFIMLTALIVLFGINILLTIVFIIALMRTLCFDGVEECRIAMIKAIRERSMFKNLSEDEANIALILLALFGKIAFITLCVMVALSFKKRETDKGDEA